MTYRPATTVEIELHQFDAESGTHGFNRSPVLGQEVGDLAAREIGILHESPPSRLWAATAFRNS